jgi:hypothetical protein
MYRASFVIFIVTNKRTINIFFFFGGATARGGPWPPLQYASKPLDPLLCLSISLFPSFSGPWTHYPAISFCTTNITKVYITTYKETLL